MSLILGKIPNFNYLSQQGFNFPFVQMYQTLSKSIRAGDYSKFKQVIDSNYHYLKDKNLLLLMNKAEILILRNLIKKVWIVLDKPSTMNYLNIPIEGL